MGLFKFIKEAGAKIFGGSAAAATPEKLQEEVKGHGFDATKLGIQVEGDKVKLSGQATNQEEFEMFAEKEHKFFLKINDATVEFVKDASGNVTEFILNQNGRGARAKKIK